MNPSTLKLYVKKLVRVEGWVNVIYLNNAGPISSQSEKNILFWLICQILNWRSATCTYLSWSTWEFSPLCSEKESLSFTQHWLLISVAIIHSIPALCFHSCYLGHETTFQISKRTFFIPLIPQPPVAQDYLLVGSADYLVYLFDFYRIILILIRNYITRMIIKGIYFS